MSQTQPQPQPGFQPARGDPPRRPQRRKLTAAQRRKNRLRILYIIVAIAMVLFLLGGLFASFTPGGFTP